MKMLYVVAMALMLTGCASMKVNHIPEESHLDFPKVNTQTTVHLGEEMLIQGTELKTKGLNIKQPIDGVCYDFAAAKYGLVGEDAKKYYFATEGRVSKAALCDPIQGLYVSKGNPNKVCVITILGGTTCYEGNMEIENYTIISPNHIQRTLIFSGKKGNTVEFMYTERSGLQIIMTHNVSYDISKNPIIGYRGARIKVIDCSNESITYEVLNNFPGRHSR